MAGTVACQGPRFGSRPGAEGTHGDMGQIRRPSAIYLREALWFQEYATA